MKKRGEGDPACGWAICEWEVSGHVNLIDVMWAKQAPWTQLEREKLEWHTHTLTRTYTHLPLCHWHTLVDTHQYIDRGLYTYITSYLVQAYRLSILIDKPTLFINSWLIRLWVDNVLLINTRSLSIVIDKTSPLSIGFPTLSNHHGYISNPIILTHLSS